jgi:integrase
VKNRLLKASRKVTVPLFVPLFALRSEPFFIMVANYMDNAPFVKVRDASRRPIRGLYKRGTAFYARISVNGKVQRLRLEAATVDEAKRKLLELKKDGPPEKPKTVLFRDFAERYLRLIEKMKKPRTVEQERYQLDGALFPFFGSMNLADILPGTVEEFRAKRLAKDICANTVNHNIVVLRNVFKKARLLRMVRHDPFEGISPLKLERRAKRFLSLEEIRAAAVWISKNVRCGQTIADAILFLAFTGARWSEGMATRWEDIDWRREKVCIGASGDTKNGSFRHVDFHDDLRNHLVELRKRNGSEKKTGLLFPSYRVPGDQYPEPLSDIRNALTRAQTALEQRHWVPHELRHHFASRCVMAGIDFKTIAEWLGHRDGGILVATVYGHLASGHGKIQAVKLNQAKPVKVESHLLSPPLVQEVAFN